MQYRKYGPAHRALRARLARQGAAGGVVCARCGELIDPRDDWDLGHVDGELAYAGAEHSACNRATSRHRVGAGAMARSGGAGSGSRLPPLKIGRGARAEMAPRPACQSYALVRTSPNKHLDKATGCEAGALDPQRRARHVEEGNESGASTLAQAKLPSGIRVVSYVIDEVVGDGGDAGGFIQNA